VKPAALQYTRPEAWRVIADAYELKIATGDVSRAGDGRSLTGCGLCWAVAQLAVRGQISGRTWATMGSQIDRLLAERDQSDLVRHGAGFLADYDAEGDSLRVMFATLLSEVRY
jgi:hypothetical protein